MSRTDEPHGWTLSGETLHRLLGTGLTAHHNPRLAAVVDRLGREDGERWFHALLERLAGDFDLAPEDLLAGRLDLATLEAMVAQARGLLLAEGARADGAIAAALAYYLTVAVGLAHLGQRLTRAPREQVDASLEQLADVLPAEWGELSLRAATTPERAAGP